jgi:HemK-related putative methylase
MDRVFPLHDDESLLLAKWASAKPGECVLDIGTGAGVIALKLAHHGAAKVIATDVNPRVAEYFRFNSELNGLTSNVEYVHSDVFDGINGERFDVIVSNPPFAPVPEQARYFLHSDGGKFGTTLVERLAREWHDHIRPEGRVYLFTLSLGCATNWRIRKFFTDAGMTPIYRTPALPIGKYTDLFSSVDGFAEWRHGLRNMGYDRLDYFGIAAGTSIEDNLIRLNEVANCGSANFGTPWNDQSWSMTARLKRYFQVRK